MPLIVAIDLQPMAPIEGVIQVQGDITNARTAEVVRISSAFLHSVLYFFFFSVPWYDYMYLSFVFSWNFVNRFRSSDILMVARLTWLCVMVLQMVYDTSGFVVRLIPAFIVITISLSLPYFKL